MTKVAPNTDEIIRSVEKILTSKGFVASHWGGRFLEYVARETLEGRGRSINGVTVAQDVFDKDAEFDPSLDSTVRVYARRLRSMLSDYYSTEGCGDLVVITIPKGGYKASFKYAEIPIISKTDGNDEPRRDASTPERKSRRVFFKPLQLGLLAFVAAMITYGVLNESFFTEKASSKITDLSIDSYPRIAILKFENQSGNHSNDFLETGLQMRMTRDLARFKTTRPTRYDQSYEALIADDLSRFDYAIQGRILSSERKADIVVELINLAKMEVIKSNRVTKNTTGVDYVEAFEDLTLAISGDFAGFEGELMKEALAKAQSKQSTMGSEIYTDFTAFECISNFTEIWTNPSPEIYDRNYLCLENLVETHPENATILAAFGTTVYWGATMTEGEIGKRSKDPFITLENGGALAEKAVKLDPTDSFAQLALSYYHLNTLDIKQALFAGEMAVIHNPADPDAVSWLSTLLAFDGQWERAIRKADEVKARYPDDYYIYYRTYFMKALIEGDLEGMAEISSRIEAGGDTETSVYCYISASANQDAKKLAAVRPLLENFAFANGKTVTGLLNHRLKSTELKLAARQYISDKNIAK